MTLKSLLVSLTMFTAAFSAGWTANADIFLPISATNTFRSGERAKVETAIARAKEQGKFVFLDMAAAWCGPCANLDKEMEEHKTELGPTLDRFEVVKLEQMHLEQFFAADFLPSEVPWFPSLFILNPQSGQWSFLYNFEALTVKKSLDIYLAKGRLADHFLSELKSTLAAGGKVDEELVSNTILNFAFERNAGDTIATAREISALAEKFPAQFDLSGSTVQSLVNNGYLRMLELGKLTWEELRKADPQALKDAETSGQMHHRVFFASVVGRTLRQEGNQAAAKQCDSVTAQADASIPVGVTPATALNLKTRRKLGCSTLKLYAGQMTAPEFSTIASSVAPELVAALSPEISQGYAAAGLFEKAVEMAKLVKSEWLKKYASYPELSARIAKAMDLRISALENQKTHP